MKSIRLSLVVYFLVLIALALGGVSALVYQTTSATLYEKQESTEALIRAQYQAQVDQARQALDRRLLRQAHLLASKARTIPLPPADTLLPALAVFQGLSPSSRLATPLWSIDPYKFAMRFPLSRALEIEIPGADDELPVHDDHPLEFFQTYRWRGTPLQRSHTLREHGFALDDSIRERLEDQREEYDDFELDGLTLRRVTLKSRVTKTRVLTTSPWRFVPPSPGPLKGSSGFAKNQPRPTFTPRPIDQSAPSIFVHYASDTSFLDAQIQGFAADRDGRLAQLQRETSAALEQLRQRFFMIGIVTFAGIVAGGLMLVRLGLAPLARLSDAVSKVSERNFELQVNADRLPIELRPIAARLSQTLEQLRQAFTREKQAAADISHELRTPLAALLTTLDVALRRPRSVEEYHGILEECRGSGQHMNHLVEQLMALARLDAGVEPLSLVTVNVADIAEECADMVRSLADDAGIELQMLPAEPVHTLCDPSKLREILLNLLHNAISYNRPQGAVELAVERLRDTVQVEVRDTGIGIAPEVIPRLFERFFRADPSRHADKPHSGLGLAIVKRYVEVMGGSIDVSSSPAGSVFRVRLPLRVVEADASAETDCVTVP